jgi:hypothetical protein
VGPSSITLNGRFTFWLASTLFGIGQIAIVWCMLEVIELKTMNAATNANRWTSKDQSAYMQQHAAQHDALPPEWLRREIARQELEDQRLQVQIDRLESKFLGDTNGKYVP